MKIGFTSSPFLANKLLAVYAVAITAVAGGVLLLPAQPPTPNVVYNLFKVGQTTADQTIVANGWKPVGYACQTATPEQIAQGAGSTVCGFKYTTASHNIITNAGIDWLACVMGKVLKCSSSVTPQSGNYIAVACLSAAPACTTTTGCPPTQLATDTTLANEITANGFYNGANRWAATFTHTNGTATYQMANTFTASATTNNICTSALFTKTTAGVMVFENSFSLTNMNNLDTLAVTWTITL